MANTNTNKGSYSCSICGKSFNTVDAYVAHVAECGAKIQKAAKKAKEREYLEKLNTEISRVKAAQDYANECLKHFKEKYPKEYELNFAPKADTKKDNKCTCNTQSKLEYGKDYIKLPEDEALTFLQLLSMLK